MAEDGNASYFLQRAQRCMNEAASCTESNDKKRWLDLAEANIKMAKAEVEAKRSKG
jgi:hypothetical protein